MVIWEQKLQKFQTIRKISAYTGLMTVNFLPPVLFRIRYINFYDMYGNLEHLSKLNKNRLKFMIGNKNFLPQYLRAINIVHIYTNTQEFKKISTLDHGNETYRKYKYKSYIINILLHLHKKAIFIYGL